MEGTSSGLPLLAVVVKEPRDGVCDRRFESVETFNYSRK